MRLTSVRLVEHRRGLGFTVNGSAVGTTPRFGVYGQRGSVGRTRGKYIHVARPRLPASDGPAHRTPPPVHTRSPACSNFPPIQTTTFGVKHRSSQRRGPVAHRELRMRLSEHRRGSGCTGNGVRWAGHAEEASLPLALGIHASDGPAHRTPPPVHTRSPACSNFPPHRTPRSEYTSTDANESIRPHRSVEHRCLIEQVSRFRSRVGPLNGWLRHDA